MDREFAWACVRLVAWALLALAAFGQALARRSVRSRGWQLNRALLLLILVSLLSVAVEVGSADGKLATAGAAAILEVFRETIFVVCIMCIAAGYKISRSTIGEEYKTPLIVAPLMLFVTSLTLASLAIAEAESRKRQHTLFVCGVVIRIAAIVYVFIFVWSASSRERETLAQKHARLRFVSGSAFKIDDVEQRDTSVPEALRGRSMAVSSGIISSSAAAEGESGNSDALYGAEAAKAHLLSGVNSAMTTYVVCYTLSWIFSVMSPWWASFLRPAMDVINFLFVGTLWALLRPREEHPYLLLDEFRFDEPAPAADWRSSSHPPDAARMAPRPAPPPPPPPGVPPPPPPVASQTTEFVPIGHAGMSRAQSLFAESEV